MQFDIKITKNALFSFQLLRDQISPCNEIGQGQPRVIIYRNLLELSLTPLPRTHTLVLGQVVLKK